MVKHIMEEEEKEKEKKKKKNLLQPNLNIFSGSNNILHFNDLY
jgi:hypothetical protein